MKEIKRHCENDRHVRRDNKFGVTWCIRCGRLYNKPSGKPITDGDKVRFNILYPPIMGAL